ECDVGIARDADCADALVVGEAEWPAALVVGGKVHGHELLGALRPGALRRRQRHELVRVGRADVERRQLWTVEAEQAAPLTQVPGDDIGVEAAAEQSLVASGTG